MIQSMKRTPKTPIVKQSAIGFAACAFAVADGSVVAPTRVQIFPAGEFRAMDGRPNDVAAWRMDGEIAARLIAAADARNTPYMFDYDHAILRKDKGVKAIAAAWWKQLEWVEGEGLFAVEVAWTPAARAHIEAREYGFTSPLFSYDEKTGDVVALLNVAITNTPAIDDMESLFAAAAASLAVTPTPQPQEESQVEELIERLQWLLNLPVGSTVEDIKAHLQKLMDQLGTSPTAAASFDLSGHIAALSLRASAQPDPAQFVPIATHKAVADSLAALQLEAQTAKVDGLVVAALSDARLLPQQEAWARDLGKSNLSALEAFIASAQPIAALSTMQSGGKDPVGGAPGGLTAADLAVCSAMGLDHNDYLKSKETK